MRQSDFRGVLMGGEGTQARPWQYTYRTSHTPVFGERTMAGWTSSLRPISIIPEIETFNELGGDTANRSSDGGDCILVDERWDYEDTACPLGRHTRIYQCGGLNESYLSVASFCYTGFPGGSEPGPTPTPPFSVPDFKVKRLRLQMPDGSTQEFRKDDMVYDCNTVSCPPDEGVYLSVNGAGLRLVMGTEANATGQSTLYMPDGSRYVFETASESGPQQFIDKNGN